MFYILFLLCMAHSSFATESYSEPSKNQSTCLKQKQKENFWPLFFKNQVMML